MHSRHLPFLRYVMRAAVPRSLPARAAQQRIWERRPWCMSRILWPRSFYASIHTTCIAYDKEPDTNIYASLDSLETHQEATSQAVHTHTLISNMNAQALVLQNMPSSSNDFWTQLVQFYLTEMHTMTPSAACEVFHTLAQLANKLRPIEEDTRVRVCKEGIRILTYHIEKNYDTINKSTQDTWRAVQVLGKPRVQDITWFIRRLVLQNKLSEATFFLSDYIKRSWNHDETPPSRALMHTLMIQMMLVKRVIQLKPAPMEGHFCASLSLYHQYADALVRLGELLEHNYLPLVPTHKEDIAWLIKLLTTFTKLEYESARSSYFRKRIGVILEGFVYHLPCGRAVSEESQQGCLRRSSRRDRMTHFTPVLTERAYNVLLYYTLYIIKKRTWCQMVLDHMIQRRSPSVAPGQVTGNILLQKSTRLRDAEMGGISAEIGMSRSGPNTEDDTEKMRQERLLMHLDGAISDKNSYRAYALIQHIAHTRMKNKRWPNGLRVASVLLRMYPELRDNRPGESIPFMHYPQFYILAMCLAVRAGNMLLMLRVFHLCKLSCISHGWQMPETVAMRFMLLLVQHVAYQKRQMHDHLEMTREIRVIALEEYMWIMRHSRRIRKLPPASMYEPLLRLLYQTAHAVSNTNADIIRIKNDMYAMKLAKQPTSRKRIHEKDA